MADKRISQLVERTTLANNDVLPIVASGASTTNKVTLQTIEDWMQGNLNFGVTSVAISVPTGLTVTGSPITSTGTFIIGFAAGYSIPTNTKQSEWDSAYNDKINSVAVTGTTTKTITLTQQDGGTLSAQWSDLQPVTSVFGRTGDVVAVEGDYSLDQLSGVGITSPSSGQVLKYDGTNWVNATEQYVGTVTSVGVSVPAAFSVTGSPITTSGTITISGAGTSAQYIDGTGSLQTFPNLIAQATNLVREVYNNSGATMTKGTVVYINGGHGNLPTIAKAKADADSTSAQTYGVVQANISDQSNGYIVVVGDLTNIDTQGYLEGTQLYLSGTTAGNYTSTKPYAPIHIVYVGIVTRSHPTQGIIAIKIQNGYEMDEIHDVDAQNPSDNDILQYKTATGLWTKTAGTTTNIAEGTNLYYTNERARQSISETITGIDYDNTTGVFSTTSGYGIPTTAKQTQWDAAYNDKINSASVSGTTTKTLTLTQQDGGTITTSWSDYDTAPVTSVFGRTGAIVATEGDYNLTQLGDVTITTPSNGQVLKYNGTTWVNDTGYVGTVTSVGLSVPTGLSVSGSPITTSGTLAISLQSGYSIPTTASQTNWDAAYNDKINSAAVTGTTTKTLTLTQQDGGTITASWTDINTDAVTSVFGRTGAVVATEGDYTLTQLGDVTITTPTNGQFLKYDGTSWINAAAGTVTSVALATGTTGTDVGVTGSPITGAGTITLNIPVASATNTGKLSNTDWSTFNGKQAALNGTGFVKISGTTISYDNNTYVDTTNAQYINGFKTFYEGISVQPTSSTTTPINFTTSMNSSQSQPVAANFGFAWNANANNQIFTGVYITAANPTNPSGYTGLQTYALRTSGNVKFAGSSEATSFIKTGGTSSQFLKADGSVDSNTYLTSYTETDTLASVTGRGASTSTQSAFNGGLIVETKYQFNTFFAYGSYSQGFSTSGGETFTWFRLGNLSPHHQLTIQYKAGSSSSEENGKIYVSNTCSFPFVEWARNTYNYHIREVRARMTGGCGSCEIWVLMRHGGSFSGSIYLQWQVIGGSDANFSAVNAAGTPGTGTNEKSINTTDGYFYRNTDNIGIGGTITANSIVKLGGTSSQFLKADGSIDSNTYLTSYTETDTLASVTSRGASTSTNVTFSGNITNTGILYMKDSGPSINENRINAGWNSTGDQIDLWINYEGYLNSNGWFRDFRVGDGKRGAAILFIDGSERLSTFSGNMYVTGKVGIGGTTSADVKLYTFSNNNTSSTYSAVFGNSNGADILAIRGDSAILMYGNITSTGGAIFRPPNNTTTSTIEFSNSDNAVISAYYNLVFAVDNSNTVGGRNIIFQRGAKGYGNQPYTMMNISGDNGHVTPGNNGTQNLGSSSLRWATVFTSDLDMSNGIGDYTIVEGYEDLFLYNNNTGKVFKFNLTEVDKSEAPAKKISNGR